MQLTACRMVSRANKLTKQVIWSKKSIKRAIPAYKAKARTAGMSDKAPENRHIMIMNISKITTTVDTLERIFKNSPQINIYVVGVKPSGQFSEIFRKKTIYCCRVLVA
jgi:hypothetical protein